MSLQSQILARLESIIIWMNQVIANSKQNHEHDELDPFDRTAIVRVELEQVSKRLTLQDLVDDLATEFIRGNVPGKFVNIIIDHTSESPSDIVKMKNGINVIPQYTVQEGALYLFTNNRIVLTNGSYGFPRPGGYYAVITDFYILTKNIPVDEFGIGYVGVGGTQLETADLRFLFSIDNRSYEPVVFELGDIGTDLISERVNVTGPYSTPNGAVVVFNSTTPGDEQSWLYVHNEEEIGAGKYQTVEANFKIFNDDDLPGSNQETLPSQYYGPLKSAFLNNFEGYFADYDTPTTRNTIITSNHKLGGKWRSLISTAGKVSFPVITSSVGGTILTLIDSSPFEADQIFEVTIECVYKDSAPGGGADQVTYKFIKRGLIYGSGSGSEIPADDQHANITALIADQNNQIEGEFHLVNDASDDSNVTSGKAIYDYLGTTVGDLTDYLLIWKEEGVSSGGDPIQQPEITVASTDFNGVQKGPSKIYVFNSANSQVVNFLVGYKKNDLVIFLGIGQGELKFLPGAGVELRGKRNIDNEYILAYPNSFATAFCIEDDILVMDGNLKLGFTGPVKITSYGDTLNEGDVNKIIPVYGTGFSANTTVSETPNVLVVEVIYVNHGQLNLKITAVGAQGSQADLTYKNNGDTFTDVNAITIQAAASPFYDGTNVVYTLERPEMSILWTNYAVRVQRSSDSTFAWVFFDGALAGDRVTLNSLISTVSETTPSATTLATWIGVNNGIIQKWAGITDDNILDPNKELIGAASLRPDFITAGVISLENAKPTIDFTNTVKYMDTAIANVLMNSGNTFTLIIVSANKLATSNGTVVNTTHTSGDRFKSVNDRSSNALLGVVVPTGQASITLNTLVQQNTSNQKITILIANNKTVTGYLNGVLQDSDTYTGDYVNEVLRVGAQHAGATPLEGNVQEIDLRPGDLTSEVSEINAYLTTKYLP